jgi:acyl-coenzyme A synthetase/AMP-(fatty) acid ligase
MNSFFQLAKNNPALEYIDGCTNEAYKINDLPRINFKRNSKRLAFAYLDNGIKSIAVFWSLIRSKHCVALLPPAMAIDLKLDLENLYCPEWIIDFSREQINGFQVVEENGVKFFSNCKKKNLKIHDDVKLLLNTSGTTGSPKFVKLSEQNIISNAQSITHYLPISHNDVTPLNLPIYYSYGLSVLTSNSIGGGKIICTNDDILKKSFWENLNKYQFTSFAGVPFVYEMLDRIGFTNKDFPSLKYLTQAGGKLQEHLIRKFAEYCNRKNILFFVMYGQTEATARMSYL